jgi:hypothetical protein
MWVWRTHTPREAALGPAASGRAWPIPPLEGRLLGRNSCGWGPIRLGSSWTGRTGARSSDGGLLPRVGESPRAALPALTDASAVGAGSQQRPSDEMPEPPCKPGSVPPGLLTTRPLARAGGGGDEHSSRTRVAARLQRAIPGGWGGPPFTRVAAGSPPYSLLHQVGFAVPPPSPEARCALTAPFHPCHASSRARTVRRSVLCGTFLRVAPTGRWPAPCPVVPGLSSAARGRRVRPGGSGDAHVARADRAGNAHPERVFDQAVRCRVAGSFPRQGFP